MGLTLWKATIAESLSGQGYATEERFPATQGFDEWYGIPRTYDEALWPSRNASIVRPQNIYEAQKGEKARVVGELDLDRRRTMEAEITSRAVARRSEPH
jgi:arylsulfatase